MDLRNGGGRPVKRREVDVQLDRITALGDPARRALYGFVVARPGDVSRDQAARAVRVSRALAAFHLDKLVRAGLLETSFRRLGKRRGRGAGRPAKLYRRSGLQVAMSLPPRENELAARLFAATLEGDPAADAALRRAARAHGAGLARDARAARPKRLEAVLERLGYEPFRTADGAMRLRNCPFDALARDFRRLTCGMNQSLLAGVIAGMHLACSAVLDPQPGGGCCCVAIVPQPGAVRARLRNRPGRYPTNPSTRNA